MKIVNCDCGESYWVNESGWPATCRCGKKLEHKPLKANKEPVAASPLQCGVMPDVAPNPEDCKRLGDSEGGLLHCPFCEHEAQLWQYEVNDRYVKGACCGDENCPMNNPGRNFEMPTIREAIALWNKRA